MEWLPMNTYENYSLVTSLPDSAELNLDMYEWRIWFSKAVKVCLAFVSDDLPVIFYQTDRRINKYLESKCGLILSIAKANEFNVIWHKIALKQKPNTLNFFRPTYTHVICLSKKPIATYPTPDVFDDGKVLYKNGIGINSAKLCVEFCKKYSKNIIDPFCGQGTVNAVADFYGMDSIGIDIDKEQSKKARNFIYNE